MTEREQSSESAIARWRQILGGLPQPVLAAAELCALPHGIDDELAGTLLEEVGAMNGTTPRVLSEVKHLPFVFAVGGRFEIASNARAALVMQLGENREAFLGGNKLLTAVYESRYRDRTDKGTATARQLRWNVAFHLAPLDSDRSIAELDAIVDRASNIGAIHDLKAVVELTNEQSKWFSDHAVDLLYYEGRLAYEEHNHPVAEEKLQLVWAESPDTHKRIVSGHFLGTMWAAQDRGDRWGDAVEVLGQAATLADKTSDHRGRAMLLTTLGSLRLRRLAPEDERLAAEDLRASIVLSVAGKDPRTEVYARTALASILIKSPGERDLDEAEMHLRRAIALDGEHPSLNDQWAKPALGRLLARRGPKHADEAVSLIEEGIARARENRDTRNLAIQLEALAGLVHRRGGAGTKEREKLLLIESLELGEKSRNLRHQAIVLARLARLAESQDLEQAIELQRRVVELNERRGDSRQRDIAVRKVKQLLRLRNNRK